MAEQCVLILSDYAGGNSAATGGAGHVVIDSYDALRERGVNAKLVVGFGESAAPATSLGGEDLREEGVIGALRAVWNRRAGSALAETLRGHDPACTVVILHQWTRYLSPASIEALRPFPLMVYLHDHFWACPNGAYYHFPHETVCDRRPLGARCLVAQCDRAGRLMKMGRVARHVALTGARRHRATRRVLLHLSDRNRQRIGALLPHEHHLTIQNPLRIQASAPPSPRPQFDIGYIGRLEPEKGIAPLLSAIRSNRWSGLFVGDGSLAPLVSATPRISWRGWQARNAATAAMRQCRLIVLPSLWPETWGLVVPEAMAAGVPVLVSNRAGAADLVDRFGGGATFDPDQPGDLERQAAKLLADPPHALGETWPAFRSYLSPERHADRLILLARHLWDIELNDSTSGAINAVKQSPALRHV